MYYVVYVLLYWINFEMLFCLLAKSSWSILMSTKFGQVMKKEILLTKPHLLCIDLKKTCKKKEKSVQRAIWYLTHHQKDQVQIRTWNYIYFCFWLYCKKKRNGILLPKLFWAYVRKIVPVIKKNFWNSRLKAKNLQNVWDH